MSEGPVTPVSFPVKKQYHLRRSALVLPFRQLYFYIFTGRSGLPDRDLTTDEPLQTNPSSTGRREENGPPPPVY